MKNAFLTLAGLFVIYFCFAADTTEKKAKKDTVVFSIKRVEFDNTFRIDTIEVDTSIQQLHIFAKYHNELFPYSTLTKTGYPLISNLYSERILGYCDYFFPSKAFQHLIQDSRNSYFFTANKPFTSLTYKNAGQSSNIQECLQLFHTQNVSESLNFGINYYNYYSFSQHESQKAGDHSVNLFIRYSGKNYFNYNQFYLNSFSLKEYGGVTDDAIVDFISNKDATSVRLKEASSVFKKYGLVSRHEWKFNNIFKSDKDSTDFIVKEYGSIIYDLNVERSKRKYTDKDTSILYSNYYFSEDASNDSIVLDKISNKLMLISPYVFKYLPNLRASINSDIFSYKLSNTISFDNTAHSALFNYKRNAIYTNTWMGADVNERLKYFDLVLSWKFCFMGYSIGDQALKADAKMFANKQKTIFLLLHASEETNTPSFLLKRFASNHQKWDEYSTNFSREKKTNISAIASIKKPSFSVSFNSITISDFIYFNENALPSQVNDILQFTSIGFKSKVKFWKFITENNAVFQFSNADLYVHVPKFVYFNSTEFEHTFHFFTGGRLYTKLGADLYFNTAYLLNSYMPSTGVFYAEKIARREPAYPRVDAHLTFKVKTVSFFIKYTHANSGYSSQRAFSAFHYPLMPSIFSYGINWLFYD